MNFSRLALAAIVVWAMSIGVSYVMDAILLPDLLAEHGGAVRPEEEIHRLSPLKFGATLIGFFVFSYAYAKGYEGSSGTQEGLRFGVIVGFLLVCFALAWQSVTFRVSSQFVFARIVGYIAEFAVYGAIVGAIYRPRRVRAVS
jgi:hypothetical protein